MVINETHSIRFPGENRGKKKTAKPATEEWVEEYKAAQRDIKKERHDLERKKQRETDRIQGEAAQRAIIERRILSMNEGNYPPPIQARLAENKKILGQQMLDRMASRAPHEPLPQPFLIEKQSVLKKIAGWFFKKEEQPQDVPAYQAPKVLSYEDAEKQLGIREVDEWEEARQQAEEESVEWDARVAGAKSREAGEPIVDMTNEAEIASVKKARGKGREKGPRKGTIIAEDVDVSDL